MKGDVMRFSVCSAVISTAVIVLSPAYSYSAGLTPSFFEQYRHQIRYSSFAGTSSLADASAQGTESESSQSSVKRKSPFKAFALSALVPGAGQFYCGSRIKPLVFLGVEAASWGLYFKFHNEGNTATDGYRQFNDEHWSRSDYQDKYLLWAYGVTDDDSVTAREMSHHLPDEPTQQFYEMTGKYDQFAWGWDDAVLRGNTLDDYSASNPPPRITGDSATPTSARRMIYEGMRHDANNKYKRADKMIFIAIINRLVSGFEAFFSARKINKHIAGGTSAFSRIDVDVSLKSVHARRDTPYMKLSYKF